MSILGVGDCTLDHFGIVERFLDPSMKVEMSTFSVQGGGAAATATVVLARWGVETNFVGKVGDDFRGDQIEMTLAEEGIDTEGLVHEPETVSQFSFVTIESSSAQRKVLYTKGTVGEIDREAVADRDLEETELVVVDGRHPDSQLALMRAANEAGVPVILNASETVPDRDELVERTDYLLASERFASRLTGVGQLDSICGSLLEAGPEAVAVTLGDEGAVAAEADHPDQTVRIAPHPVDVVDTTGAGDVFAGAFTYGILQEWPLEKTAEFANVAAALSCKGIGARGAIPSLDEVESRFG
jgi:sugar/nucleoside kinase (ribokinase family)